MFASDRPGFSLTLLALMLVCMALMCLSACSGKSETTPEAPSGTVHEGTTPAALPVFPAPSNLPRSASVPPTDGDLLVEGDDSSSDIASNLTATPWVGYCEFSPSWDPALSPGAADLSYAGYAFTNLTEFAGEPGMRLSWTTPPVNYGNLYLGMANFAMDGWEWFQASPTGFTALPGMTDYINGSGELYVVVLLTGTDSCELDWLMVGERLAIKPFLYSDVNPDPSLNIAPQVVNFNASASQVTGGTIIGYDFDFDDDGTYDIIGNTDGLASYNYTTPGSHTCRVMVHDDASQTAEATRTFWLVNPGNVAPTASFTATPPIGAAPLSVHLDASGSTDDAGIVKYEWDLDGDGLFETDGGVLPTLDYIFSKRGTTTVTLRVIDADYAEDDDTTNVTLSNGFEFVTVATGLSINTNTDMIISDTGTAARPCVTWQNYIGKDLCFARATSADGSTWAAPQSPVSTINETGYSPVLEKTLLNRPIIAFGLRNTGDGLFDLHTVYATNDNCTSWSLPSDVNVDDHVGGSNSITSVNSRPAIVSVARYGYMGQSSVRYYLATDANGTLWNPGVELVQSQPGVQMGGVDLIESFNGFSFAPVAAFLYSTSSAETTGFGTVHASSADGSTWDTPIFKSGYRADAVSLLTTGGIPTLAAGSGAQFGKLHYLRADDSGGSAWTADPTELLSGGHGGSCCMRIVDGKPAICYFSFAGGDLWYMAAANAEGSAWNDPYKVASVGNVGKHCSMVVYNTDRPIICYFDGTSNSLVCAYWN